MISFVLPVYNCLKETSASLPDFVQLLNQLSYAYEIIIVDDHSENGNAFKTLAAENGCTYIRNPKNSGKGYSVRTGFAKAGGDKLIFMDGDFPFEMDIIHRIVACLQDEGNDIVIGDRTLPGSGYPSEISFTRKLGSKILSFISGIFFVPSYRDTQCGIKGFKGTAARNIFSNAKINGFAFDLEILYIATKNKYNIKRIPVTAKKQESSNVNVIVHGFGTLIDLVKISFNNLSGKYHR
jgi:dolichyl-phosphate beta-glucosyltransferase